MFSDKSKYFSNTLLIFIIFTFFVYSVLSYYALRIKTPKPFGVIAISTVRQRALLQICEVRHFSQANFDTRTKSMPFSLRQIADNA